MSEEKALVPVEQREVEFYEDKIMAVLVDIDGEREVFVPVRPICDYLGITWTGQHDRIRRDPVLSKVMSIVRVTRTIDASRPYDMICLPLDFIHGWLFSISATRIKDEDRRAKLIRYQERCYRILAAAFTDKSAKPEHEVSATMQNLMQIREMGRAIMQMAEE